MRNNHTGSILIVCKRYTENGKSIQWNSTGNIVIHALKSIVISGKHGIKFQQGNVFSIREKNNTQSK
jgi:hypothetical protein